MDAYIFPGQGSQYAGMGQELAQESAIAEEVFRVVDAALGFPLTATMFGDDAGALTPTQVQQPAIFAHSVAAFAAVRKRDGEGPAMVAGHSLGEYAALVAAGCMELAEAARLVGTRGELMARAGEEIGGAMAAVIGMDTAAVETLVTDASAAGTVVIANYNCPGQIVISGEAGAIEAARTLARERGARAIPLKVSGAFHSPLMAPAREALLPFIEAAQIRDAAIPLVSNVDAIPRTDAGEIRQALIAQVTGSVRWEQSVRAMVGHGVRQFVELGPGTVLSKLIPRIDDSVTVWSAATMPAVHAFLQARGH